MQSYVGKIDAGVQENAIILFIPSLMGLIREDPCLKYHLRETTGGIKKGNESASSGTTFSSHKQ